MREGKTKRNRITRRKNKEKLKEKFRTRENKVLKCRMKEGKAKRNRKRTN